MAQDPESNDEQQYGGSLDTSHDLDMVQLFRSLGVDAEIQADVIHGILESNGIPSIVVRAAAYPSLGIEVHVPSASLADAERLISEAKAAGPEAAAEAEEASEEAR